MQATLTFRRRRDALKFERFYTRFSKEGVTVSSGTENVDVTVFNVTEEKKAFIDNYVEKTNR